MQCRIFLQWKHGPLGLKLLDEFFLPSLEEKLLLLNLCPFVHFPFSPEGWVQKAVDGVPGL